MTPILVEIQGAREMEQGLARLTDVFTNMRSVFERLGEKFFPPIQGRIDQGIPPPLSPATEARKAKLYGGASQILIASKTLYSSFAVGGPGSIERITNQDAEFGSSIFYGIFHQEGRGVPERKIIDIDGAQEAQLVEEATQASIEKIEALGFEVH